MNCPTHPEAPAVAFCRTCGKPLCEECKHPAQGTVFCAEHAPATAAAPPVPPAGGTATATATPSGYHSAVSPGLAAFLGFIPGVGAIYNGQYAKGLIHAIIFGLLISLMHSSGDNPTIILAFLMVAWEFYMIFEAYHTARKRLAGEQVDEFSSLINMRGGAGRFPTGAVVLIVLGVVLLLNTLDIIDFRYVARYWPVILILIGVYMLWGRLSEAGSVREQEARNEHQ